MVSFEVGSLPTLIMFQNKPPSVDLSIPVQKIKERVGQQQKSLAWFQTGGEKEGENRHREWREYNT